jgi:hypothetical protein
MKIHSVNKFRSHGYLLTIVAILHSAQKFRSYTDSLVAARGQMGYKK